MGKANSPQAVFEMEKWSDGIASRDLRVNFSVDTQILAYLVDGTYVRLRELIRDIAECPFARLLGSQFAVLEFVGIRKREHFLRLAYKKEEGRPGSKANISSLFEYRNKLETGEHKYSSFRQDIEDVVRKEIKDLEDTYGFDFASPDFTQDALARAADLCLRTEISKEDALIALASTLGSEDGSDDVVILSNDAEFCNSYNAPANSALIGAVFSDAGVSKPRVVHIRKFGPPGEENTNLCRAQDPGESDTILEQGVRETLRNLIVAELKEKNAKRLLGETIPCMSAKKGATKDLVCFRLRDGMELIEGRYLTIVSRDLNFVYNTRYGIAGYYNHGPIATYPHVRTDEKTSEISFELSGISETGEREPLAPEILTALRKSGNLVLYSTDG